MNSISSVSNSVYHMEPIKPTRPHAPTPPPDGNLENRKPPAEPQKISVSRPGFRTGSIVDVSA